MRKGLVIAIVMGVILIGGLIITTFFVNDKSDSVGGTNLDEEFWKDDGVSLAIIKDTGEYVCYGCNNAEMLGGEEVAMCVDPVIDAIEFVDESFERYCSNDFSVVDSGKVKDRGNSCLELGCEVDTLYVGSKNSDKYYGCDCHYAKRILPENLKCFSSVEEAGSAGYTRSEC
ncbi:MAG: hypothetical protein Q8P57_00615 [Candidatus Pacearchaeota archaeon]|nr:hypothetical protein [Candidatus Pacearchaeota archaeon]